MGRTNKIFCNLCGDLYEIGDQNIYAINLRPNKASLAVIVPKHGIELRMSSDEHIDNHICIQCIVAIKMVIIPSAVANKPSDVHK